MTTKVELFLREVKKYKPKNENKAVKSENFLAKTSNILETRKGFRRNAVSKTAIMRVPGFEPGSQAWEACVLPLDYTRLFFSFRFNI